MNLSKQIYNCNVENDLHTCECELPNPLDVRRSKDYVGLQEIFRVRESRGRGRDASVDFRAILFILFIYLSIFFIFFFGGGVRSELFSSCSVFSKPFLCWFVPSKSFLGSCVHKIIFILVLFCALKIVFFLFCTQNKFRVILYPQNNSDLHRFVLYSE